MRSAASRPVGAQRFQTSHSITSSRAQAGDELGSTAFAVAALPRSRFSPESWRSIASPAFSCWRACWSRFLLNLNPERCPPEISTVTFQTDKKA